MAIGHDYVYNEKPAYIKGLLNVVDSATMVLIPLIGAFSATMLEDMAMKYGHAFRHHSSKTISGINNLAYIATIGAIQNLLTLILPSILGMHPDYGKRYRMGFEKLIFVHILSGVTLVGLTTLAVKCNLIVSRLTLFAGIALGVSSLIQNIIVSESYDLLTAVIWPYGPPIVLH